MLIKSPTSYEVKIINQMKNTRKAIVFIFLAFTLIGLCGFTTAKPIFDFTKASNGTIHVKPNENKKFAVIICKDKQSYTYVFENTDVVLPLQIGSGIYEISYYENVSKNLYRLLDKKKLEVFIENDNNVFINPIYNINFDSDSTFIKSMTALIDDNMEDEQKINAFYDYIVHNYSYDYEKASKINNRNYVPDIDEIFNNKKGICYDYSSAFASILRYHGMPCKLVMGYAKNIESYHAWNEVYLNGEWIIFDLTTDSVYMNANYMPNLYKNESDYLKFKEF